MNDPNDVRSQFEAEFARPNGLNLCRMDDEYISTPTPWAFAAYQAALQSPAVRELVAFMAKVEEIADDYVPNSSDQAAQALEELRDALKSAIADTALRTLGAGHE